MWAFCSFCCISHATNNISKKNKIPVILDTDMGFDDWIALLYVAKNKKVQLLAVTIDCYGETYCANNEGAKNAARILSLAGKPDVSIYTGISPNNNYWPSFPKVIRKQATAMNVTGFKLTSKYTKHAIKSAPAAKKIAQLIEQYGRKKNSVTFISIGSAANINDAIQYVEKQPKKKRTLFENGLKMIYKGGGAFGKPVINKEKSETLSNEKIFGNLNIPGIYTTKNTQAAWNIFVAAVKVDGLLRSNLPVTFIPISLSNQFPVTKKALSFIEKNIENEKIKQFVTNIILDTVKIQGGWEAGLSFWDPTVVVTALNPGLITKKYKETEVCINTNKNFSLYVKKKKDNCFIKEHYDYAAMLINESASILSENKIKEVKTCNMLHVPVKKVTIISNINRQKFFVELFKGIGGTIN